MTASELTELLPFLTKQERAEIDKLTAVKPAEHIWQPDPRNVPQTTAYYTEAYETLYGGAAGGGKSALLLGLARTKHTQSLLLRREYPQLKRSLIEDSFEFFGDRKLYNSTDHVWRIGNKRIEFGNMERIGSPNVPGDEANYASAPYDFIGFDQLEQFTEYGYIFMFSRARTKRPGQRVRVVSSANPVGEGVDWIMRRWAAWLDDKHPNPAKSGEIRYYTADAEGHDIEVSADHPDAISRTFIAARLSDNPYLGDEYRRSLMLLPEPLRSAVLDGNWSAMLTDDAYQVIPRAWVKAAMARWTEQKPARAMDCVGVDVARGGEDHTVLARRFGTWYAPLEKHTGIETNDGPKVAAMVQAALLEGGGGIANIDVIGIGSSVYDHASAVLNLNVTAINFAEHSDAQDKSGKFNFVNKRAEFWWKFREALDPEAGEGLALPNDSDLLADLTSPRYSVQTNGIKIESKEEIKKRIGRSTDFGDAVVMALPAYAVESGVIHNEEYTISDG